MRGEPNPRQWEMYAQNNCVFHHRLPPSYQYMRNWNKGYLEWSRRNRITRYDEPILIHLYSEVLQKFRTASRGGGQNRNFATGSGTTTPWPTGCSRATR